MSIRHSSQWPVPATTPSPATAKTHAAEVTPRMFLTPSRNTRPAPMNPMPVMTPPTACGEIL